jgi:hypothetical protein
MKKESLAESFRYKVNEKNYEAALGVREPVRAFKLRSLLR